MIHCWLRYGLEDCSSVATFKGVCESLEVCQPTAFLLENVDSLESKQQKGTPEETPSRVLVFFVSVSTCAFCFGILIIRPICNLSCPQTVTSTATIIFTDTSQGHRLFWTYHVISAISRISCSEIRMMSKTPQTNAAHCTLYCTAIFDLNLLAECG